MIRKSKPMAYAVSCKLTGARVADGAGAGTWLVQVLVRSLVAE